MPKFAKNSPRGFFKIINFFYSIMKNFDQFFSKFEKNKVFTISSPYMSIFMKFESCTK